jgi:hypothetical protein
VVASKHPLVKPLLHRPTSAAIIRSPGDSTSNVPYRRQVARGGAVVVLGDTWAACAPQQQRHRARPNGHGWLLLCSPHQCRWQLLLPTKYIEVQG